MDRLIELDSLFLEAALETLYIVALTLGIGGTGGLLLGTLLYTTRAGGITPNRAVHVGLNLVVNFFRPIPFVIFIAEIVVVDDEVAVVALPLLHIPTTRAQRLPPEISRVDCQRLTENIKSDVANKIMFSVF